jgi:hypothetical protein
VVQELSAAGDGQHYVAKFLFEAQPKAYLLMSKVLLGDEGSTLQWMQSCWETLMTLQEIQNQALQLSTGDRWQLVKVLLASLKQEANHNPKERSLSRLRGIAKIATTTGESNPHADYITYLTEKYRQCEF